MTENKCSLRGPNNVCMSEKAFRGKPKLIVGDKCPFPLECLANIFCNKHIIISQDEIIVSGQHKIERV